MHAALLGALLITAAPRCATPRSFARLTPRAFEPPSRAPLVLAPGQAEAERLPLRRLLRPHKVANYTIALASYAHGEPYLTTQRLHVRTARSVGGVDLTLAWTKAQLLRTDWGQRVLRRFYAEFSKHGRWVWKPHIILHALGQLREGDFVVYLDASRFFQKGFEHSVIPLANFLYANRRGAVDSSRLSFGMVPGVRLKKRNSSPWFWPKRCELCEQLALMGLCSAPSDEACCASYAHAPHVQASFSIWQKSDLTLQFVRAWLANCEDIEVLRRSRQGDQCVASLLSAAYSRAVGLRVPWIHLPKARSGNPLKDPALLFGPFAANGTLPPFLRESDPYPECARGTPPYDGIMCDARPAGASGRR